ncbi:hypothetical protein [Ornithobacterium rhinotracheale]|uniref:DUF4177 domain-containing protein n=1 Tax=Ornithobacterium rhinotracheale (strain ATCC 51463 / DSM 15997 / CCUG 23171 / CIP 104009 / LMG 9086) TaxID=867902 RepID=I4A0B9_ORNRL|nr:hypothetical protein [Ornithobacterium rhinotracheale]AFL97403.1 hypothetical protein Ornrh_1219 [Ornithobacterium rhinotracheale DSM 15997]
MKEIILTERVVFSIGGKHPSESFTFPAIQKRLDEGYVVKSIFYSPTGGANSVNGIALTVHLQKPKTEPQ